MNMVMQAESLTIELAATTLLTIRRSVTSNIPNAYALKELELEFLPFITMPKTVLLQYLKAKAAYKWHLSNLVTFIRLASLVKIDLMEWINNPFEKIEPPPDRGQLLLKF